MDWRTFLLNIQHFLQGCIKTVVLDTCVVSYLKSTVEFEVWMDFFGAKIRIEYEISGVLAKSLLNKIDSFNIKVIWGSVLDKNAVPHRPYHKVFITVRNKDKDVTGLPAPADINISNEHSLLLPASQSGRKCVSVAAALRAEQGSWEPIKVCIREIGEQ